MNHEFIERAEKIISFNISTSDLLSLDYKKEIRHLFSKHFFNGVELSGVDKVDKEKINNVIASLKNIDSLMFKQMHNYNLKGVGPGEMTLYCIVDSATLGGGSSAGTDILTECGQYEVKAVNITASGEATNFKLGGTVSLNEILTDVNNLKDELNLPGTKTEISKSTINTMRTTVPEKFDYIENRFAELTCEYFQDHKTIFFNHNKSIEKQGFVESITNVKIEDVSIERITSGTVKPSVRLK